MVGEGRRRILRDVSWGERGRGDGGGGRGGFLGGRLGGCMSWLRECSTWMVSGL